jgi:ABC-type transport system involved in cytochrome bd biosynthesis fused ATPase/permease subunit
VVVLDEVASSLSATEAAALEVTLEARLSGTMRLRVSHDSAALARCDAVAVVDAARVIEIGAPAALAADPSSHFAALCGERAAPCDAPSSAP